MLQSFPVVLRQQAGFYLCYIQLKDAARFGDISRQVFEAISYAEQMDIIDDLRVTPNELIEIILKGFRRSWTRHIHSGRAVDADKTALRLIEFERRIELFEISRRIDVLALKQILYDTINDKRFHVSLTI
jgi:hypothetical protein